MITLPLVPLDLFSLVTLWAHPRMEPTGALVRQAAWYHKARPSFSDALALVRREVSAGRVLFFDIGSPFLAVGRRTFEWRCNPVLAALSVSLEIGSCSMAKKP